MQNFSLTPELGQLAIVVSTATAFDTGEGTTRDEQKKIFQAEADVVYESDLVKQYDDAQITRTAHREDIKRKLQDPDIAGMVLIGHGDIGSFWLDGGGERLRWHDVAKAAGCLKLGHFVQRMCGHYPRDISKTPFTDIPTLPLGTFAVVDQRNVIAAHGLAIPDEHPDETLFKPVYSDSRNSYEDILSLYKHFSLNKTPEEPPDA